MIGRLHGDRYAALEMNDSFCLVFACLGYMQKSGMHDD